MTWLLLTLVEFHWLGDLFVVDVAFSMLWMKHHYTVNVFHCAVFLHQPRASQIWVRAMAVLLVNLHYNATYLLISLYIHTWMHRQTQMYRWTDTRTDTHIYIHACTHTHTHTCVHKQTDGHTHTYARMHTHTHTHACTHTHTHTHARTHTHTPISQPFVPMEVFPIYKTMIISCHNTSRNNTCK